MKNINKNYIIFGLTILIVILLVIILLIVLNGKPQFSFSNQTDKNQAEEKNKSEESNKDDEIESNNQENTNDNEDNSDSNTNQNEVVDNSNTTNSSVDSSSNNISDKASSEEELISYFENESTQIDTYNDQDNATFREKAKTTFINIIDFIFYDKEIKGYTFDELTNSAKLKVIKIALTVDNKIEEYFPNYKTIIKDKYNDIKGKLAVKYLEFTSSLCDQVGEDTCNQAKEDFSNMKESFGFTWSLLKELATNGKEKIKNYYENEFRK